MRQEIRSYYFQLVKHDPAAVERFKQIVREADETFADQAIAKALAGKLPN